VLQRATEDDEFFDLPSDGLVRVKPPVRKEHEDIFHESKKKVRSYKEKARQKAENKYNYL